MINVQYSFYFKIEWKMLNLIAMGQRGKRLVNLVRWILRWPDAVGSQWKFSLDPQAAHIGWHWCSHQCCQPIWVSFCKFFWVGNTCSFSSNPSTAIGRQEVHPLFIKSNPLVFNLSAEPAYNVNVPIDVGFIGDQIWYLKPT
jgi:hypothetical protein